MALVFDPEGVETRILHRLVDFLGKDVLEVGCGDGRLTWRYADQAASVLAIDPKENKIALARERTPEHLRSLVTFQTADIASLDAPEAAFDVAILSWSI
jgi:2-polyprenyl-3-methyl-5-hydroxy-6-metoxy-1,4-benzoquinol methylase